jgi:hypothetical protein
MKLMECERGKRAKSKNSRISNLTKEKKSHKTPTVKRNQTSPLN